MRFVKTIWHWCNSFENQWIWNVKTVKTISLYSTSFILITRILNGNVISEVIVLKQFSLNSIKELIFLLSFIFFLYRPILGYFDFALKKIYSLGVSKVEILFLFFFIVFIFCFPLFQILPISYWIIAGLWCFSLGYLSFFFSFEL